MADWITHRWYGLPASVEAARAALPTDPAEIGAVIPPRDQPLRVLDGLAAISFTARIQMPRPQGVLDDKPELLAALHGSLDAAVE